MVERWWSCSPAASALLALASAAACSVYDGSLLQPADEGGGSGAAAAGGSQAGNGSGGAGTSAGTGSGPPTGGGEASEGGGAGICAGSAGAGGMEPAPPVDITAFGTPIALITEPQGLGSRSLETLRDGELPPEGADDPSRQYDTYTGESGRGEDWLGYDFGAQRTFVRMLFQNGLIFFDGGWFESISVQILVRDEWLEVSSKVTPGYAGAESVNFRVHQLDFSPTNGTAIRVFGEPGGSASFISCGELRVFEEPAL